VHTSSDISEFRLKEAAVAYGHVGNVTAYFMLGFLRKCDGPIRDTVRAAKQRAIPSVAMIGPSRHLLAPMSAPIHGTTKTRTIRSRYNSAGIKTFVRSKKWIAHAAAPHTTLAIGPFRRDLGA
jgi:hypothetical protein